MLAQIHMRLYLSYNADCRSDLVVSFSPFLITQPFAKYIEEESPKFAKVNH